MNRSSADQSEDMRTPSLTPNVIINVSVASGASKVTIGDSVSDKTMPFGAIQV